MRGEQASAEDRIGEVLVECAACGESCGLTVDTSAGTEQSDFEDCPVCCRPKEVYLRCQPGETGSISVKSD